MPTPKRYFLGDEVFLLLTLLEDKDRLPVAGKVVWVTPPGAQGNRAAGIGVQFADSAEGEAVKGKIETMLAGTLTRTSRRTRCKSRAAYPRRARSAALDPASEGDAAPHQARRNAGESQPGARRKARRRTSPAAP